MNKKQMAEIYIQFSGNVTKLYYDELNTTNPNKVYFGE